MKTRQWGGASVVVLAGLLLAGRAQAADAEVGTIEEVVVTALKRSQSVQEVPAAITAVTGAALEAQGAGDLKAAVQVLPNLVWGEHDGTALVTIRGVGSFVDSGVTEPTVALYVDGVYLPRSTMATVRAVDLDRIEVLRGPQGTLYGRNATGGAINFVSKAPARDFEGAVNLSTGSREAWGVSGYLSGPLANGVYARLSGGHEEQEGYAKVLNTGQRLNGTDVDYVRGALRLEPTEDLTADLAVRYERNKAANAYQQPLGPILVAGPDGFTTTPNELLSDRPFEGDVDTFVASGRLDWKLSDNLSLRSLTSYVDHTSDVAFDSDGSLTDFFSVEPVAPFRRTSESYAQELNLVGDYERLSWILGAFYFHEKAGNALPVTLGAVGGPANGVPAGTVLYQSVDSKLETVSLYGDVTWTLRPRLRLNLGLRYNHEEQDFLQTYAVGSFVGPLTAPLGGSKDKLLPKVALQYDLTDDVHGYVQWSRGYKSGGANLPGGGAELLGAANGLYAPEQIDAYEVGLKSTAAGGTLTANVAAYYYDYSQLQVTIDIPPAVTVVRNADAKIYGAEMELRWRASENLTLNGAATWTHARFDGFSSFDPVAGVTVDLDGKPLPQAPDFTFGVGAEYRIDLGGELLSSLTLRGNVFHSDKMVIRYFGNPEEIRKAYTLTDISATLASEDGKTELNGFVNNLFDEVYKSHILSFGIGYYGNYSAPRTWGVRLTRRF